MTTRDAFLITDRYDRAINDLEADAIARLNAALDAAYKNLEKQLRASYSGLQSQGALVAAQRKLLIVDELSQALDLIKPDDEPSYQALLQDSIQASDDMGGLLADELIQAYESDFPLAQFARVPIEAAALQARDGVQRLSRHSQDFRTAASAVVEQGLIQGWGPSRVTDILRKEVGATKSKAETIARTEISSALNDAADQRYKDNGIEYFQLIVTPSDSLCPYCAARNGKVYKVGSMHVPIHVRCRCLKIPWSKSWQEKGITDDTFIQDFRDRTLADLAADGQAPNNGPTYWEKKAGLKTAPKPVWNPDDWTPPKTEPTLESRIEAARQFTLNKAKEQAPDLIVNAAGVVGSAIGQHLAGPAGALAGDLLGAVAAHQVVAASQAVLSAKEKLRQSEEFKLASKVNKLRRLGRATLSEFNDPEFQRKYMNETTGNVTGWGVGNTVATVGNMIPGVSAIPGKGAIAAMVSVPRVQKARIRIVERAKKKKARKKNRAASRERQRQRNQRRGSNGN
ncbi:MAG: minor capsid protein [Cyanobacteria bacterium P01_D01_bin.36]